MAAQLPRGPGGHKSFAHEKNAELALDGDLQLDGSCSGWQAQKPFSKVAETPNILVFLTLRPGGVAYKRFSASVVLRHTVNSSKALLVLLTTSPVVAPLTTLLALLQYCCSGSDGRQLVFLHF